MTTIPEKVVHTWLDGVGNIWQLDDAGIFWITDDVTGDMVEEVVTFGIGNEMSRLAAKVKELEEPDGYFKGRYMICLDANRALRLENEHFESENTQLRAENKRLREIIRRLPHRNDCRMVTAKLLTGDDSDCDCGAALKETTDD